MATREDADLRASLLRTQALNAAQGKLIRKYSPKTEHSCKVVEQSWRQFCQTMHPGKDPKDLLERQDIEILKIFFDYLLQKRLRAQKPSLQFVSAHGKLRTLRMLYKKWFRCPMSESTGEQLFLYLKFHIGGLAPSEPRPKPIPNAQDLRLMLHFLLARDKTSFPDESCRVMLFVLMVIHAMTGVRPGSVMNPSNTSSYKKDQTGGGTRPVQQELEKAEHNSCMVSAETKSFEEEMDEDMTGVETAIHEELPEQLREELPRLCYRNFELWVIRDKEDFVVRSMLTINFTRFKGELNRQQRKQFTFLSRQDPLVCLPTLIATIGLRAGAFAHKSLCTARDLLSLDVPEGRHKLRIAWRDDFLDKPFFTMPGKDGKAKEITSDQASRWLSNLGKGMGLRDSLTWRCFRRLVSNSVDECGSEEQRNQITGHLDSQTYRAHYQDQIIRLDVAAAVMGEKSEEHIACELSSMCVDTDPRANVGLELSDRERLEALPEIIDLNKQREALVGRLRCDYVTVTRADNEDPRLRLKEELDKKLATAKRRAERQLLNEKRREFYVNRDIDDINRQLGDQTEEVVETEPPSLQLMPERQRISEFLSAHFEKPLLERRISFVELLLSLCQRRQLPDNLPKRHRQVSDSPPPAVDKTTAKLSIRSTKLACPFCQHDTRLHEEDRRRLMRKDSLARHITVHLKAMKNRNHYACCHTDCQDSSFRRAEQLLNHMAKVHEAILPVMILH